ncbi:MAG: hypothetical protein CMI81_01390 [Candidatus Pelagibacter sp.]|nr:hypothetical protein [Candidatus Pelagibacter sp.]OUV98136.1 MAG: hypothetical protein CBD02_01930 [Candidatus Pelagibacter sp. TMED142]
MKKEFNKKGYVILKKFFNSKEINSLYENLWNCSYYYLYKLKPYRNFLNKLKKNKSNFYYKFSNFYNFFEKDEKNTLHTLQHIYAQNTEIQSFFFTEKLKKIYSELLGIKHSQPLFLHGPNIFVNKPKTKRLLYKWHSEARFYPKRRNFLNIWFPLFTNKNKKNGTMQIVEGSHLNFDYPINEYIGYDKKTLNSQNNFYQKEIPSKYLKNFKKKSVEINVGDLILFERNLVHSSALNSSKDFSFALTGRLWDFSKDFTLSSNFGINENSYSRNQLNGHPDIEDY